MAFDKYKEMVLQTTEKYSKQLGELQNKFAALRAKALRELAQGMDLNQKLSILSQRVA